MDVWTFWFFFWDHSTKKKGTEKRRKMALLEIAQLECQLPKHSTTRQVAIPFWLNGKSFGDCFTRWIQDMKSISIQISEKNQAISRQLMCHLKKNNDGIPTLSHSHQRKNGQQEQGILCSRTISIEALSLIIETSTEEAHSLAASWLPIRSLLSSATGRKRTKTKEKEAPFCKRGKLHTPGN